MKYRFKTKSIEMRVGELRLHHSANREVKPGRVRYFTREMNADALGRFAVWRDGRNMYVIDGQHRKLALEELGVPDWPVRCDLYEGMTFSDACQQFLDLNNQLTVSSYDKYDKGVKAGYAECVESKRIAEEAGFRVAHPTHDGNISAVQALRDVWKLDQGESLIRSLAWLSSAWGHTAVAADGQIIRGLGLVAQANNGAIDEAALIKKLSKYPGGPTNLIGAARQRREFKGGSIGRNLAGIVVDVYNKGRRSHQLDPV